MTPAYRVLVTSSRTWNQPEVVWQALDEELDRAGRMAPPALTVVHGAATAGGDADARAWCRSAGRWPWVVEEPHPAQWQVHGKRAGIVRNLEMVAAGAGVCLAFLDVCRRPDCHQLDVHATHGSRHCLTAARKAGIVVVRFGFVDG